MDQSGKITVPTGAKIVNHVVDKGIKVTDIQVNLQSDWNIASIQEDFEGLPDNSKDIAMSLRGDELESSGGIRVTPDNWVIYADSNMSLDMQVKLPRQTTEGKITLASAEFTFDWVDGSEGGGGNEGGGGDTDPPSGQTHTISIQQGENGKVSSTSSIETDESGKITSFPSTTPDPGYIFDHWEDTQGNIVTTDTIFTGDTTIKPVFIANAEDNPSNGTTITASEANSQGFTYEPYLDGVKITAFKNVNYKANIVVPENIGDFKILNIGDGAFQGQTNIKEISLPDSVKIIGDNAFKGCTYLNKITMSTGIESIGSYAFSGNENLKELDFHNSQIVFGNFVFDGCNLQSIEIPKGCTLNANSLQGISELNMRVNDVTNLKIDSGILSCIANNMVNDTEAKGRIVGDNGDTLDIPRNALWLNGIWQDANYEFCDMSASDPDTSQYYFYYTVPGHLEGDINVPYTSNGVARDYSGVEIPDELKDKVRLHFKSGASYFSDTTFSAPKEIWIDTPYNEDSAKKCKGLATKIAHYTDKTIFMHEDVTGYTYLGEVFRPEINTEYMSGDMFNIVADTYPDGYNPANNFYFTATDRGVKIGNRLRHVDISNGGLILRGKGSSTSQYHQAIDVVYKDDTNKVFATSDDIRINFDISDTVYLNGVVLNEGIESGVQYDWDTNPWSIDDYLNNYKVVSDIKLGGFRFNISNSYYEENTAEVDRLLNGEFTLPTSFGDMRLYSFERSSVNEGTAERIKITTLNIPESYNFIGSDVCDSFGSLEVINIGANVSSISDVAFRLIPNLREINVDERNPYFKSIDGVLYSKDGTKLVKVPNALSNYTIEDSVTTIKAGAFNSCDNITNLVIPSSVTTLESECFVNMRSLEELKIPGSITAVPSNLAYTCPNLVRLTFEEGVKTIGNWVVANNKNPNLVVNIPSTVTSMGKIFANSSSNRTEAATININKATNKLSGKPWGATASTLTINWLG